MPESILPEPGANLTDKQRKFCEEYVLDWNATRSAIAAGYSENTARAIGSENLTKPDIKDYIKSLKGKTEEMAGISKLRVTQELAKVAFGSAAQMRRDWSEVKDWNKLTKDEKSIIAEIEVTSKVIAHKDPDSGEEIERNVIEEKIKYKVYDKLKALEMLNRMYGYNSPDEMAVGISIPAFRWAEPDKANQKQNES
jgi:phage terminase small subunit